MAVKIHISPNKALYVKDPQGSTLGKRILGTSVSMLSELGFESFTFKKLAEEAGTTEVTIYRYFENKHKLLLYLLTWYWEWMQFHIQFMTQNITSPREKLDIALRAIMSSSRTNPMVDFIDERKLYQIVIEESTKAYHTKEVDAENREGLFLTYKSLSKLIAGILLEVRPDLNYPNSIATTLLEMSKNFYYFGQHLPSLTNIENREDPEEEAYQILRYMVDCMVGGMGI